MRLLILLLVLSPCILAQDKHHQNIYQNARESIVAIRCVLPVLGEKSGSGVILDKEGYILTSYAVVPEGATNIRVWLSQPKLIPAKIIATREKDEITLIKIDPKDLSLKSIKLGDSEKTEIGDICYTLGNAANSIINDHEPSFSVGIISGLYTLDETFGDATYLGPVFETTAAVNPGMEGAPLLNDEGEMIGIITLNFSPARWLGSAIPINYLKPIIEEMKETTPPEQPATPATEDAKPYIGLKVSQKDGKLVVDEVDKNSPAWDEGIRKGDVIVKILGKEIHTLEEFNKIIEGLKPGDSILVEIDIGEGQTEEIKISVGTKK